MNSMEKRAEFISPCTLLFILCYVAEFEVCVIFCDVGVASLSHSMEICSKCFAVLVCFHAWKVTLYTEILLDTRTALSDLGWTMSQGSEVSWNCSAIPSVNRMWAKPLKADDRTQLSFVEYPYCCHVPLIVRSCWINFKGVRRPRRSSQVQSHIWLTSKPAVIYCSLPASRVTAPVVSSCDQILSWVLFAFGKS